MFKGASLFQFLKLQSLYSSARQQEKRARLIPKSHILLLYTSLAQTELHGHVWLQVKLKNVVLSLGVLATFLYILNKLDGIHFCAQMERSERSTGREGWCAIMR